MHVGGRLPRVIRPTVNNGDHNIGVGDKEENLEVRKESTYIHILLLSTPTFCVRSDSVTVIDISQMA